MRTVEELTDALVSAPFVHRDATRRGPANPTAFTDLESRLHVKLPSDVRAFYSRMDGTDLLDAEHGLITLWPLDRWTRLDQEAAQYAKDAPAGAIVFADYSLWCWAYAAEFEPGSERTIVHIVGGAGGVPIAETFTEFLELVVTNSQRLFGDAG
jgi:hypothetical protein